MPVWLETINVKEPFRAVQAGKIEFKEGRDQIVAAIKESAWFKGTEEPDDLITCVDELAEAEDVESFDGAWNWLYDLADTDRVWVSIF